MSKAICFQTILPVLIYRVEDKQTLLVTTVGFLVHSVTRHRKALSEMLTHMQAFRVFR